MPKGRPKTEDSYQVSITSPDGNKYEVVKQDIEQALLGFKPKEISNKVIIRVQKKDLKYERVLGVPHARRIFNNELSTKIIARNIARALNPNG